MRSELDGDKTEEEGSATEEPALQTKSDTVVASENTQDEKSPDATTEHGQTSEHMPPDGNEPLPDKTSHEDVEKDLHQVTLAVEGSTLAERDDDTKEEEEEEEIEIEEEEEEEEEEEDEEETETVIWKMRVNKGSRRCAFCEVNCRARSSCVTCGWTR
jgi:hypothetical protein